MFPKNQRVTKKEDFDKIFKKGKALHSPSFTIRLIKNNFHISRFAVLVSKKVSNKAVLRNKTKRALRESIKKNIKLFPINHDVVLYAHPSSLEISTSDANKLLQKMLKKP